MNMSERDIDRQIAGIEAQIRIAEKRIEEYRLTLSILTLVLRDLNNKKVVEDAEKIIRGT